MDIWQIDKLVLFIAFVIPGFISIKTYQLIVPSSGSTASIQLIDAVSYSSINYAFLLAPIYFVEYYELAEHSTFFYALFYAFTILGFPVLIAFGFKKIRMTEWFQNNAPHPIQKPWDFVFGQRQGYWVRATLKNGKVIGGYFFDKSFASDGHVPEQIYIEQSWIINADGGLERAKADTAGVLILSGEMSCIEFTKITPLGATYEQK